MKQWREEVVRHKVDSFLSIVKDCGGSCERKGACFDWYENYVIYEVKIPENKVEEFVARTWDLTYKNKV